MTTLYPVEITHEQNFGEGQPLFEYYYNQKSAQLRIRNLCDFLAALQEK